MTHSTRDRMCDAAMRKVTELDFSASRREVWLIVDVVLAEIERPGSAVYAAWGATDASGGQYAAMIRAIREGK